MKNLETYANDAQRNNYGNILIAKDDEKLLKEWGNWDVAEVDGDDVWVEGPCSGHWLSGERIQAYLNWRDGR